MIKPNCIRQGMGGLKGEDRAASHAWSFSLLAEYNAGAEAQQIAARHNVGTECVYSRLRWARDNAGPGVETRKRREIEGDAWLHELMTTDTSASAIARRVGKSPKTVWERIERARERRREKESWENLDRR